MSVERSAVTDIGLFFAITAGAFALERQAGVPALFAGLGPICVMTLVAVTIVRLRGESWAVLGLKRPRRLWSTPFWFVALFGGFYLLNVGAMTLVQSELLAPPDLSKFEPLRGDLRLLVIGLVSVWVTAAFFEELIFRGFLLDRLQKILGNDVAGIALAVFVQSVIFGALHFYQGATGMAFTAVAGLVFAIFYVLQGRNIWVQVMVHGIVDTVGLLNFYFSGERA